MISTPPSRVSGLSALTWSRILTAVWIVGGVVFVIALIFFVLSGRHTPQWVFWLVIPFIALGAAARIVRVSGRPNEKREVRAGYTTLRRSHPEVPQLDPRSGAIVREAGHPYLARSARSKSSADGIGAPPPSLLRRLGPTLLGAAGALAFVTLVYWLVDGFAAKRVLGFMLVELAVLACFAIALAIGSIAGRRSIRRLREAAPGQLALWFTAFPEFASAMAQIDPAPGTQTADAAPSRKASASSTGLTFWRGNPLWEAGTLPWPRVLSVQCDRVWRGRYSYPRVVITFRAENSDEVFAVGLVRAHATGLPLSTMAEARWIANQLEQLRASATTARVL